MKRRSSWTRRSNGHQATVYTVTRTKRWRNVMPALHKSVNGFKDFPRARVEPRICSAIVRSVHFTAPLSNLLFFQDWPPLSSLKIDRLHIIDGADKLDAGIVRSITNINWNGPTNERSATHVIGLITVLPSAKAKRKRAKRVIVIFRLWQTDRWYKIVNISSCWKMDDVNKKDCLLLNILLALLLNVQYMCIRIDFFYPKSYYF